MTTAFFSKPWAQGLKWPVVFGVVAAFAMAALSLFIPNQYQAQASLMPPSARTSLSGVLLAANNLLGMTGMSMGGGVSGDPLYEEIFKSRRVREALLNTEFSYSVPRFFGSPRSVKMKLYDWYRTQRVLGNIRDFTMDLALVELADDFESKKDDKTGISRVSMTSVSPELSAAVVERALVLVDRYLSTEARTESGETATYLEGRLKEAYATLGNREAAMVKLARENLNYSTSLDPKIRIDGARLEMELNLQRQIVQTVRTQLENALMKERNDTPVLNVLDHAAVPTKKSWPPRFAMVVMTFIAAAGLNWYLHNRQWLFSIEPSRSEDAPAQP